MSKNSRYQSDTFRSAPLPVRFLIARIRKIPVIRGLWEVAGKHIWRSLKPSESKWRVNQLLRRTRLFLTPRTRILKIKQSLTATSEQSRTETYITFLIVTRKMGIRDNHLSEVLESFIQTTRYPERCEILLKIDDDDDLWFYSGIQKKFKHLNIRFFVTPRGRGYADAHLHHAYISDYAASTSKAWVGLSDDALLSRKDWDLDIYELIAGGDIFVAGSQPSDTVTQIIDADLSRPNTLFSFACEPYAVISWGLVNKLRLASQDHEGWPVFLGDRFCFDTLWSSIILILREEHGIDIYNNIKPHCTRAPQRLSWDSNPERSAVRTEALTHFFSQAATESRRLVVANLAKLL